MFQIACLNVRWMSQRAIANDESKSCYEASYYKVKLRNESLIMSRTLEPIIVVG